MLTVNLLIISGVITKVSVDSISGKQEVKLYSYNCI